MAGYRIYSAGVEVVEEGLWLLPEEETRHLVKSLRARVGDALEAIDGLGQVYACELVDCGKKRATVRVCAQTFVSARLPELFLLQALPKGKTMGQVVRRVTELGVRHIFPVQTAHSELRLAEDKKEKKQAEWQLDAIEACKQSGNAWVPQVYPILSLEEWVAQYAEGKTLLVASLQEESQTVFDWVGQGASAAQKSWGWAIGPEGDFSPSEYDLLAQVGGKATSLGQHVLRVETAAVAAVSQLTLALSK